MHDLLECPPAKSSHHGLPPPQPTIERAELIHKHLDCNLTAYIRKDYFLKYTQLTAVGRLLSEEPTVVMAAKAIRNGGYIRHRSVRYESFTAALHYSQGIETSELLV